MLKWRMGWKELLAFSGLFLCLLFIHYWLERHSVWLVPTYFIAFLFYGLIFRSHAMSAYTIIFLALLMRLALVFGPPSLSDDYFRFVWDGQLWASGVNPYLHIPSSIQDQSDKALDPILYHQLNSPEYHTTYPPLSQYIFSVPAWLEITETNSAMTLIRAILILFEIGCIVLLFQLTSQVSRVALYAFNPLIVLELTGNLHFEGVVLFFVLLAFWFYGKGRWVQSAVALVFGVLAKLTPLMFLPVLVKKIGIKRSAISYVIIVSLLVLLSIPILNVEIIRGMFTGLDLFFRKFEFNAGLFFLFREIGFWVRGYDIVQTLGPWMSYVALGLILIYSFGIVRRETEWPAAFMFVATIQLFLATTVHPWYVIPLIGFSVLTGYSFPILWSLMAFGSYLGYLPNGYEHPMLLIALEYLLVGSIMIYEIFKKKPLLNER